MTPAAFRVGVTRDLEPWHRAAGRPDIGFELLDAAGVEWEFIASDAPKLDAELIAGYDALFVEGPAVPAGAVEGNERLAVVARFGVGYEKVDVDACTANGIAVTLARDGVRRPVAVSALTLILALSQRLLELDRLTRRGGWAERDAYMGLGLVGRTVGAVGLGNIGQELFRLLAPFDVERIAYDPYVEPAAATAAGSELADLETVCAESDFVVVLCALTPETSGLVDARLIGRMKPTAFLVNVARGPIVDQAALTEALRAGRIRGAGLDVFEREPIDPADPLLALENVIATPHSLCATDQCMRDCGVAACESILDVARGRAPRGLLNTEVLTTERWMARVAAGSRS
jgi:phosphoglycerate dehydrogenase-like enzyme